jgi:hypothetical protein
MVSPTTWVAETTSLTPGCRRARETKEIDVENIEKLVVPGVGRSYGGGGGRVKSGGLLARIGVARRLDRLRTIALAPAAPRW